MKVLIVEDQSRNRKLLRTRLGAGAHGLERHNAVLVRKLESSNRELRQTLAELQGAHEQILELQQTLETRVEQRTAALGAANEELEAFSCSIAHDLRTPLLNIAGYAELLQENAGGQLDDTSRDCLARIVGGAGRMHRLIGALLEFARLGPEPLHLTDIDLEVVLEEALETLRLESSERHIQWQRQRLPRVKGDFALLRQVFVNLIGNAIKYTRTRYPAVIEIGWRTGRAAELVIFVRDNGVGFDTQHASTLFGVFQRLAGAEPFEGTGIGLANAQRIVIRHGGRIWAQAAMGRGATFHFSMQPADSLDGSSAMHLPRAG